jgi:hypothetical protein
MADADGKSVRIPPFNGEKKNFVMWWTRFKAYAKVQKYSQALAIIKEPSMPTTQADGEALDRSDQANLPTLMAMSHNEKALANLTVAFTTPKAMSHFYRASDEEWPDGLAANVVKSLYKKYRPSDTIAGVEYDAELEKFKLKKNQDPTELFDHFTEANVRFGINEPDEKKLIALALKNFRLNMSKPSVC